MVANNIRRKEMEAAGLASNDSDSDSDFLLRNASNFTRNNGGGPGASGDTAMVISDDEETGEEDDQEDDLDDGLNFDTQSQQATPHMEPPLPAAALTDMLQLQSPSGLVALACMNDMFGTAGIPHPLKVNVDAVRSHWNNQRCLFWLPALDHGAVNLQYIYQTMVYRINDDVSMRLAYRAWLSLGDTNALFVLIVDEASL